MARTNRNGQTYCECGEPKADRATYCVECKAERIHFNSSNPDAKRRHRHRLRTAVAKAKEART